jgi:hypothetical protein
MLLIVTMLRVYNKVENYKRNNSLICFDRNLYIGHSNIGGPYGRGVFAGRNFREGETVEIAPYIQDKISNVRGIMKDYVYKKPHTVDDIVIVFGYGSMYNHSQDPNTHLRVDDSNLVITANKDIDKDEEIFISYGDGYWEHREMK